MPTIDELVTNVNNGAREVVDAHARYLEASQALKTVLTSPPALLTETNRLQAELTKANAEIEAQRHINKTLFDNMVRGVRGGFEQTINDQKAEIERLLAEIAILNTEIAKLKEAANANTIKG